MQTQIKQHNTLTFSLGIGFTFLIAIIGYLLASFSGFSRIGPLACAIIIAVIYRNIFHYPEKIKKGISFSSIYLLRLAIILYGLKLNIHVIFEDGIGLILKSILVLGLSLLIMYFIGKLFKADNQLSILLAIGTGICGAAAIAATAPILKAREENTAISIAIIALIGTFFSIGYTLLLPILPISAEDYATWSGLSLHELAHVALAAEPAGDNLLATALLAKLSRVFLLVPFSFILIVWMKLKQRNSNKPTVKITFPYFLLGFVAMSIFGSYVLGTRIHVSDSLMGFVNQATTFLLTSAMVGLGLNVDLKAIKNTALRPLGAMIFTSIILSVVTYFIVQI